MNSNQLFNVTLECLSLDELFSKRLNIPNYQRSYSWLITHVRDLLKDAYTTHERQTEYLMGTVILHDKDDNQEDNKKCLDIVDGQQRLVTLTILVNELQGLEPQQEKKLPLLQGEFNEDSAANIRKTRTVIQDFLDGKSKQDIKSFQDFLLGKDRRNGSLRFFVLQLRGANALDRAYAFFDSVNSKGMKLNDFDLLKAHHLMFIPAKQEKLASNHNDDWMSRDEDSQAHLFSTFLRRIRMWARGQDRDSKQERPDYNEFCSVAEPGHETDEEHTFNRYMQPAAFRSWRRVGERILLSMDYPVLDSEALMPAQITQTIEGGDVILSLRQTLSQALCGAIS